MRGLHPSRLRRPHRSSAVSGIPVDTTARIGGPDAAAEGQWRRINGPEAGTLFSTGAAAAGGAYVDWNSGEPNGGSSENCLMMRGNAADRWNDQACSSTWLDGYVVEITS